jgi:2-C-methyl-D-erythritol 4-phosphate cytidylyltransferase
MKDLVFALVPAAGIGTRMNTPVSKQFIELGGIPVIIRTLLAFERSELIDGIVVSARICEQKQIQRLANEYHISKLLGIARGGTTRQDSVRNGLNHLIKLLKADQSDSMPPCPKNSYVLIHDGARPFVTAKIIEDSICCVKRHKACGVGVPTKDTIKRVDEGNGSERVILETLRRDSLWVIQTPQSFSLPLIRNLHRKAFQDGLVCTDDTSLAEHYDRKCLMIEGDYRNIKITTPEDILFGELILKQLEIPPS